MSWRGRLSTWVPVGDGITPAAREHSKEADFLPLKADGAFPADGQWRGHGRERRGHVNRAGVWRASRARGRVPQLLVRRVPPRAINLEAPRRPIPMHAFPSSITIPIITHTIL
jgi:hypothetical protein